MQMMDLSGTGRGNRGRGRAGQAHFGRGGGESMELDNGSMNSTRGARGGRGARGSGPFGTSSTRGRGKQFRDVMMQEDGEGQSLFGNQQQQQSGRGRRNQQNQNHMMIEHNNTTNNTNRQQQQGANRGGRQQARGGRVSFDPVTHDVNMDGNVIGARASVFEAKRKQQQQMSANRDAAMSDVFSAATGMSDSPKKKSRSPFAVAESKSLFKERLSTPTPGNGSGFQGPTARFQDQKKKNAESIFRLKSNTELAGGAVFNLSASASPFGGKFNANARDRGGNVDMNEYEEEDENEEYEDQEEEEDDVQITGEKRAKFGQPLRGSVSGGKLFDFKPTMGYNAIAEKEAAVKEKIFQFRPIEEDEEEEYDEEPNEELEEDYEEEPEEYYEEEEEEEEQEESFQPPPRQQQARASTQFETNKRHQSVSASSKPAAISAKPGGEIKTRGRGGSKFTDEDKFGRVCFFLRSFFLSFYLLVF
jgi:hypothetical protein